MVIVPKENQEETKKKKSFSPSSIVQLFLSSSACVCVCLCVLPVIVCFGALPEDYSGGIDAPPPPLLTGDVTFRSNGTLLAVLLKRASLTEDGARLT